MYAVQWEPVEQQPTGGSGYDITIGHKGKQGTRTLYSCVDPAGVDGTRRVYKSTDYGETWVSVLAHDSVRTVRAVPTDPDTVYVGRAGVWKSTDGGQSWSVCNMGPETLDITTLAIAGSVHDVVYAAGVRGSIVDPGPPPWWRYWGIAYRTTDAGASWVDVTPVVPTPEWLRINDLAVHPLDPDTALMCCGSGHPALYRGIYATTNGGATWSQTYDAEDLFVVTISRSNPAVVYAGGSNLILKSTDGGVSWTEIQSAPLGTTHSIAINPTNENQVYVSVFDGVWYTSDGGVTWAHKATGMWLRTTSRMCLDDAQPNTIFTGEHDAGIYRTTNGGEYWEQVSLWLPSRDVRKVVTAEHGGYYWTYDTWATVDVTTNGGGSWTSTFHGGTDQADMVRPVAETVLFAGSYIPPTLGPRYYITFVIKRSTDRGFSWCDVFSRYGTSGMTEFRQFGVAPSDPKRIYGTARVDGRTTILRSTDCGGHWQETQQIAAPFFYNAVAVWAGDPDVIYLGTNDGRVFVSYDGGMTVNECGELPDPVEIRRLTVSANGVVIYAATLVGVYRSDNSGVDWVPASDGMDCLAVADLVMDPNGSTLWAASAVQDPGPHVYYLHLGTSEWTAANEGLPTGATVYSLSFDSGRYLHAGTSVGVYTRDVREEGQVSADATYPNWGRKLVREPNTDNFHVAYTNGDMTFYSQSTDGGETWSVAEPIGLGKYPAIILTQAPLVPWVVYLTPEGSIMRARRMAPGVWDQAVVWLGSEQARAGAPSLASDVVGMGDAVAQAVFPVYNGDPPVQNYVYYCSFTAQGVLQMVQLDAAGPTFCYGASIALTPGYMGHVAWIRGQSVIYRQCLNSVWSPPYQISSAVIWPPTEPASNPSLEAYGECIYCVWRGPNDYGIFPGDIWQRSRRLDWPPDQWTPIPWNQSQTPGQESDFPVMTTDFVTVWHEEAPPDNIDIWGRFALNPGPEPFFVSPLPSRYPHADGYWVPGITKFVCNAVWTEQVLPLYDVEFGTHSYIPALGKGLGPGPHDGYEPGLYYAAMLGQPEQSPYCLSRGGYAKLGSWDADTSGEVLMYRLPYLDPLRVYKLRAVIYHEGKETWSAAMRCDSGAWSLLKSLPGTPDTVWLRLPRQSYKQDARIILELARVTGDYASLAELKLFQIEERTREDEGPQSTGTAGEFVTRLRTCTPNPFDRATSINYELGCSGPVALSVHDVSGRLVRRLESGTRPAGRHVARWDGTDGRGRVVPAGVYFIRLSAGGEISTGRLTLVR